MSANPRGDAVIRLAIFCGVFEALAVGLRFLARRQSRASFAAEDWLIAATLIPSYAMLVLGSLMVTVGGGGLHQDTLSRSELVLFLKTLNSTLITYSLTIAMVKISILLLYRRIIAISPTFRKATVVVGVACVLWALVAVLCFVFQCHPVSGLWTPEDMFTDKCFNLAAYYKGISGAHMGLDIIILCMPLPTVWRLDIPFAQRVVLSFMFMLGGFVCVASLMRILTVDIMRGADMTYTIVTPYLWSQLEPTIAIICACMTTYRPLITALDFKMLSSMSWSGRTASKNRGQSSRNTFDSEAQ